ncbi:MAG TPA: tRNA 2-selenouridine(34) synthase MnmH [Flavitalea sp.]|nr:tRNA 2-selenouridine(34) synthase MnmH [Flavitalea sp.]
MAIEKVLIERFIQMSEKSPVFDVRSPSEYLQAHLPGAYNLPLFTDEERKKVGTMYKQVSREQAIKLGLEFFGPRMRTTVEEVEAICQKYPKNQEGKHHVLVHCWRGGMRSAAVAWLLELYGFRVTTLAGGYKKFRNYVLKVFEYSFEFRILGGYTGSGKTEVLKMLENSGETVIDLEKLAHHKGSAFGAINEPPQPSQEMFENKLALELYRKFMISYNDAEVYGNRDTKEMVPVWLEDESQRIGSINVPQSIWTRMRKSPVIFLDVPFDKRLEHLVTGYGGCEKEKMINAILRIQKRLGGLETKNAINHLIENNLRESFRVLLNYYDKHYLKALQNRDHWEGLVTNISCVEVNPVTNAQKILAVEYTQATKV